jgi:hypothetical protein
LDAIRVNSLAPAGFLQVRQSRFPPDKHTRRRRYPIGHRPDGAPGCRGHRGALSQFFYTAVGPDFFLARHLVPESSESIIAPPGSCRFRYSRERATSVPRQTQSPGDVAITGGGFRGLAGRCATIETAKNFFLLRRDARREMIPDGHITCRIRDTRDAVFSKYEIKPPFSVAELSHNQIK